VKASARAPFEKPWIRVFCCHAHAFELLDVNSGIATFVGYGYVCVKLV